MCVARVAHNIIFCNSHIHTHTYSPFPDQKKQKTYLLDFSLSLFEMGNSKSKGRKTIRVINRTKEQLLMVVSHRANLGVRLHFYIFNISQLRLADSRTSAEKKNATSQSTH